MCGPWPPPPPERPEIPPPWTPDQPPETPWLPRPHPSPPQVPLVPGPDDFRNERELLLGSLLKRRIVLVTGLLTEQLATTAAAQIMTLDAEDGEPLELHIASPDGDLGAALMLADTVGLATAPVTAHCRGALGGPALAPFAAAQRRLASPRATFRMIEPRTSLSGRVDEIAAEAAALRQQLTNLHALLARTTGQLAHRIAADMEKGLILSADEARNYGLVHAIAGGGANSRAPVTDT
ncbi:MAG: ATP-dependent Clp protease proteolytic subunit [Actinomycetota bacterium]|nr:ATP-dependent Clp protease proteolytic subunit [Actinomycetota bacterium]